MSASDCGLRFVLLRHDLPASSARESHYDLMLEREADLFTLELREVLQSGVSQTARELPPHRKAYLDYEGPVSHDRGEVHAIDRGSLAFAVWSDSTIRLELRGSEFRGVLTLEREALQEGAPAFWRVDFKAF